MNSATIRTALVLAIVTFGCEQQGSTSALPEEDSTTQSLDGTAGEVTADGAVVADGAVAADGDVAADAFVVDMSTLDAQQPDAQQPDAAPMLDTDGDGVSDAVDNCIGAANPTQRDADEDGLGDACDVGDTDEDGIPDRDDPCPAEPLPTPDSDADGIGDACDLCPRDADPLQLDADGDGIGDLCEIPGDDDADGVPDATDSCPTTRNPAQADSDLDGVGDACDGCPQASDPDQLDSDGDGINDGCDVCPDAAEVDGDHVDADGDGVPLCAQDCDDSDPRRAPGRAELCDEIDNNCDGRIDEGFLALGEPCAVGLGACRVLGEVACINGGEAACDAAATLPSAELCNGLDDDCDGVVDEGLVNCCPAQATEACGVNVGRCERGMRSCGDDRAWGPCDGIGPAEEICNGQDDDCDGLLDEDLGRRTCGQGVCERVLPACNAGDDPQCDPLAGASPEICDGLDNDCDGLVDEGEPLLGPDNPTAFEQAVHDAIGAGITALRADVARGTVAGRHHALVLLAMMEQKVRVDGRGPVVGFDGLPPEDQALMVTIMAQLIANERAFTNPNQQIYTYQAGPGVSALAVWRRSGGPEDVGAAVDTSVALDNGLAALIRSQAADGGYSYGGPGEDLSTTHLGVNGLAASAGAHEGAATAVALVPGVLARLQKPDGGFGYRPVNPSSSSMTAAGLWCLRLADVPPDDPKTQAALTWLNRNYQPGAVIGGGFVANSPYYALWALTKALQTIPPAIPGGIGRAQIGGTLSPDELGYPGTPPSAWFDTAYILFQWQDGDGRWGTRFGGSLSGWTPQSSHLFALLTLERSLGGVPAGACNGF